MKTSAWLHTVLALYVWAIESVPMGSWNRQQGERLFVALLNRHGIGLDDLFTLLFVASPAILMWAAWNWRSPWLAGLGLAIDASWLGMQFRSWWVPYIFGANVQWQIAYSRGPTTKLLPSFGNHIAPDGMHLVIHVLLASAMLTGAVSVWRLLRARRASQDAAQTIRLHSL